MTEHPSLRWRSLSKPSHSESFSMCSKSGQRWSCLSMAAEQQMLLSKQGPCLPHNECRQAARTPAANSADMHTHRADLRGRPCFKSNPPVHSGLHSA